MMQPLAAPAGRNAIVMDQSAGDFSDQMALVAGNGNLSVQFFYQQIRIEDPMDPAANGTFKAVLCVRKRPHGDKHTESVRMISERAAAQLYPREYAYFKQYQDVPTDGTPLAEVPGISQSQIAILVLYNVRCVEDLVALSADQVSQIGMDARMAYGVATKWLQAKQGSDAMIREAEREAALAAQNDRLTSENAAMAAQLAQLAAQVDILSKMGGGAAAAVVQGSGKAQMVDATPDVDVPPGADVLFSGGAVVTGNDDLLGSEEPAPARSVTLPGLTKRKG